MKTKAYDAMPAAICEMGGWEMLVRGEAPEAIRWFLTVHQQHGPIHGASGHVARYAEQFRTGVMWWGNPTYWTFKWSRLGKAWSDKLYTQYTHRVKLGLDWILRRDVMLNESQAKFQDALDQARLAGLSVPEIAAALDGREVP